MKFRKSVHAVVIWYFKDQYFVAGEIQLPPVYAWSAVSPVFTVPANDGEKLAQAIESARLVSKSREQLTQSDSETKTWNCEEEKAWENASRLWSVRWEEGGNVHITPWERFPPGDYEGVAWRPFIKAEKVLSPPVSSQDIAQEILNQL